MRIVQYGLRDILKIVAILSGNVSRRLTPELKWNGNSMVECLREEQIMGVRFPLVPRNGSHYTKIGSAIIYRSGNRSGVAWVTVSQGIL